MALPLIGVTKISLTKPISTTHLSWNRLCGFYVPLECTQAHSHHEQNKIQTVTVNLTQCDCLYPCPFHITSVYTVHIIYGKHIKKISSFVYGAEYFIVLIGLFVIIADSSFREISNSVGWASTYCNPQYSTSLYSMFVCSPSSTQNSHRAFKVCN